MCVSVLIWTLYYDTYVHVVLTYIITLNLELNIFPTCLNYLIRCCSPPYPWNYDIQYLIYTSWKRFHSIFHISKLKVYKKIYDFSPSIYSYVKTWPFSMPRPFTPGIIIWRNINLHYLRLFPHELQLFWSGVFWEKGFRGFSFFFC